MDSAVEVVVVVVVVVAVVHEEVFALAKAETGCSRQHGSCH